MPEPTEGRVWTVEAKGDDCPLCGHGPEMHDGEACGYALPDTYTHMTDVQTCDCPMSAPASTSSPRASP